MIYLNEADDEQERKKEREQERKWFWESVRFYCLIGFHITIIIVQLCILIYLISKI